MFKYFATTISGVKMLVEQLRGNVKKIDGVVFKKVKCRHCGYTWFTKSKMKYVTCPNCGKKTKVEGEVRKYERKKEKKE